MARRIANLDEALAAAAEVFKPEYVDQWLATRNDMLDGYSPAWLIGNGQGDRVAALLDALAEGVVF